MYQALYRKYRPKTFSDVVGQSHITTILKNQIEKDRTSHAYIFTGTRGTGKTSCAKILARAINCTNPQNGDPCNQCEACLSVLSESSMDVSEIDAASNNKVDDIRDLLEETRYTPSSLKKRVYIIDEVHMLTTQAFNALLKTLEEPPKHVLFILATTEIHKVLPTILSRCQRFDFKRINMYDISERLVEIATLEGFTLNSDAADIIAKLADGGLRDALSILDRCIVSDENVITAQMVCDRVGAIDYSKLISLMDYSIFGETLRAIELINELYNDGIEISSVLSQMLTLSRDMLMFKITKDPSFGIIYNVSTEKFGQMCEAINEQRLTSFIDIISNSLSILQKSQNKKIDVELCVIKLCKNVVSDNTSIEDRMLILEDKVTNYKPTVITQNVVVESDKVPMKQVEKSVPKAPRKPSNPEEKGTQNVEQYRHLLRNLRSVYKNRELIFLNENSKALFYSDRIEILVDDEITYNMVASVEKRQKIGEKATELFEKDLFIEVRFESDSNEQASTENSLDSVLERACKNNITIKNMED
ncbi:MAG: DNA polymerase III subunit gamma/tau [Clostridia bacterium]